MTGTRVHAVVTGGGTSGHVVPALAILEALVDAGHEPAELRYVGARRGVETTLLASTPYAAEFLPVSGLQRSLRPSATMANLLFVVRLWRSRVEARRLVRAWRPRVVVSVGGYASEPMSRAALAADVPLVCVSYDRAPGLATRRQARRATVCAVAFPDSDLPRAQHTGAPVRRVMRTLDRQARRDDARASWGVPAGTRLLVVVGGSLGSATLNEFVVGLLGHLGGAPGASTDVAVFHVCGQRNIDDPPPSAPPGVWYRRVGYESRMDDLYAACDLLVARAGASTVAEIATVGVPAVLVPWPGAADAHQDLNARWLADAGAAVTMADDEVLSPSGIDRVLALLDDEARLSSLAQRARDAGAVHRGDTLARVIDDAVQ